MDEVFGEIISSGCGSDSVMLRFLRSAMDEAHRNMHRADGSVELLNAKSKFYELAMILVEGCLKLIEDNEEIPENNRGKMLTDLTESGDKVRGRLSELRLDMADKDREMAERFQSEYRLRQALELAERELASLRGRATADEGFSAVGTDCILELKDSVDWKVWSIKQQLEDAGESPTARDFKALEILRMSSDIDGLMENLDMAFGKMMMENAETLFLEKQWRCAIEKDTILVLIRGFMNDLPNNFAAKLVKSEKQSPPESLNWSELIKEISLLHCELQALFCPNRVKGYDSSDESSNNNIRRTSSEPLPEVTYGKEPQREGEDDGNGHHVAKMIKNHEAIKRRQNAELKRLKREILGERERLSTKRLMDSISPTRRIQEILLRLENVIKIDEYRGVYGRENLNFLDEEKIDLSDELKKLKQQADDSTMQGLITEENFAVLLEGLINDSYLEFFNYQTEIVIRDDIFSFLLGEMFNDLRIRFECKEIESHVGKQVYCIVCSEAVRHFCSVEGCKSEKHQNARDDDHMEEECRKSDERKECEDWRTNGEIKCIKSNGNQSLSQHENVKVGESLLENPSCTGYVSENIESILKEDIWKVFFREMIKEWKMRMEAIDFENLIREEKYHFIKVEAANDAFISFRESEAPTLNPCAQDVLSRKKSSKNLEACGEVNLAYQNALLNQLGSIFSSLGEFQQEIAAFESRLHQKLEMNFLRLEELTRHKDILIQLVASLRKNELLYKKAFSRRCHNLRLAEIEVDLLGDQVDALLGLLRKIYSTLNQHSSVLSSYDGVSDILNLIQKELSSVASHRN